MFRNMGWLRTISGMFSSIATLDLVHTTRFLKYVWPFYNIMHESVNALILHSFTAMTLNSERVV